VKELALGLLAYEILHNPMNFEPIPELPKAEPWVNAKIDIPKFVRRGKTYEQILEIKKQIWLTAHKQEEATT
jgi:hypothetical protein